MHQLILERRFVKRLLPVVLDSPNTKHTSYHSHFCQFMGNIFRIGHIHASNVRLNFGDAVPLDRQNLFTEKLRTSTRASTNGCLAQLYCNSYTSYSSQLTAISLSLSLSHLQYVESIYNMFSSIYRNQRALSHAHTIGSYVATNG